MANKKQAVNYKKCSISFTLIVEVDEDTKEFVSIDYFWDNGIAYWNAIEQVREDIIWKTISYPYPAPWRHARVLFEQIWVAVRKMF